MKKVIPKVRENLSKSEKAFLFILEEEDKKNPYTDQQIADMLETNRDCVMSLRKKFDVKNSRERRKDLVQDTIKQILKLNPSISQRELTSKLQKKGFCISRFVVAQIIDEIEENIRYGNIEGLKCQEHEQVTSLESAFTQLIGHNGSLKEVVKKAKAAILYPPMGLHTLITGDTGVGKSQLAEIMYNYAIEIGQIPPDKTLIRFNCADYADNPQLLLSLLFGYVKGAFTGADSEKTGLIDNANNGILFLDEIHRLPPEGQEILFDVIDRGAYKRLGETESFRRINAMIIAATTESIEVRLLLTFRRRIPVTICIPSLESRSLKERLELIRLFFIKESRRTRASIRVH
ncbi:sigma 54-interacting transcriptional regulator, partial [bacterium]|nr:sigma 54-interacting transcriptional regulator [bacterium]